MTASRSIRSSSPLRSKLVTLAFATTVLLQGCAHFAGPPDDLDYSRTRKSEAGHYRGTILPQTDPVPQGRLHTWTLHLETADGAPVEAAEIDVDGGMPQHGHGLPTRPRVSRALGGGDYLVEGMKFNMGGWWEVTFPVRATAGADTLVFNLAL